jgi:hypothetical protein
VLLLLSSELFSWRGFFTFHLAHLRLGGRVDALWVQGDQIFAILLVNLGVLVLAPGNRDGFALVQAELSNHYLGVPWVGRVADTPSVPSQNSVQNPDLCFLPLLFVWAEHICFYLFESVLWSCATEIITMYTDR